MKDTEIIESLIGKMGLAAGRHLYGILGSYGRLKEFAEKLQQASLPDGTRFPAPVSVNRRIMEAISDEEFKRLAEGEARMPEPVVGAVTAGFESFMRELLKNKTTSILNGLEMLFAYDVEFTVLRTMAADENKVILLLPGKRTGGKTIMYPDWNAGSYTLPSTLVAQDHLWELKEKA